MTQLLLINQKSISKIGKNFKSLSNFPGFKPNILKCEAAGIDSLKRVKVGVHGIKWINLTTDTTIYKFQDCQSLETYDSWNKQLYDDTFYEWELIPPHLIQLILVKFQISF